MIERPMDVLSYFPVRKTKLQKQQFRDAVQEYLTQLGYEVAVEKGRFGAQNVVAGNPETAKYLLTGHYDTPAGMLLPNLITPCNPVTFLCYQLLLVGLFFVAALIVATVTMLLTQNETLTFLVAYVAYFGMLFLLMLGPANQNNANDNTSGVVTLLEIARTLQVNQRDKVCFVLFDLEEAGLLGSSSYRSRHKAETEHQLVVNLDCVGDGDHLVLFPSKKVKMDQKTMARLFALEGWFGNKNITVRDKGFSYYPSDQKNFPLGIGVAAFRKKRGVGLYCSRIHTKKDTILEETNVNLLRAALTTLITGDNK